MSKITVRPREIGTGEQGNRDQITTTRVIETQTLFSTTWSETYRTSDSSFTRQHTHSSTFIVSESLFKCYTEISLRILPQSPWPSRVLVESTSKVSSTHYPRWHPRCYTCKSQPSNTKVSRWSSDKLRTKMSGLMTPVFNSSPTLVPHTPRPLVSSPLSSPLSLGTIKVVPYHLTPFHLVCERLRHPQTSLNTLSLTTPKRFHINNHPYLFTFSPLKRFHINKYPYLFTFSPLNLTFSTFSSLSLITPTPFHLLTHITRFVRYNKQQ